MRRVFISGGHGGQFGQLRVEDGAEQRLLGGSVRHHCGGHTNAFATGLADANEGLHELGGQFALGIRHHDGVVILALRIQRSGADQIHQGVQRFQIGGLLRRGHGAAQHHHECNDPCKCLFHPLLHIPYSS